MTINTHRGLFKYTQLQFGVSAAPAILQHTMDTTLQGIPGVAVYIDILDPPWMLSWGNWKLPDCGSREVNVYFLLLLWSTWDMFSAEGVHPSEEKVRAIREAPNPTNVSQLFPGSDCLLYKVHSESGQHAVASLFALAQRQVGRGRESRI